MPTRSAFISFTRQDAAIAERLAAELERRGVSVFRADQAIAPGESWAARLQEEIAKSSLVFTIVSRASAKSEFVASETALALAEAQKGRTVVIPVIAERGVELPYFLRQVQALDFTNPSSESVHRALDSVLRYAGGDPRDSGFAGRNTEAQLDALRSSRRSLEVEKAILTERRAVWSSTVAASVGVLASVLSLVAGVLTLSAFKSFLGSNLLFILGVLFGVVGSALAFWLQIRLQSSGRHEEHK